MVVYSDVVVGSCVLVATRKAGKLNFLSFWDVRDLRPRTTEHDRANHSTS